MNIQIKRFFALNLLVLATTFTTLHSQSYSGLWSKSNGEASKTGEVLDRKSTPAKYEKFSLNYEDFKSALENSKSRSLAKTSSSITLNFPNENGELEQFEVYEAPIMEAGLQEKFPDIRSYVGKNVKNPSKTIRISITNYGLHGMIMGGENGTVFIDPETTSKSSYLVYNRNQLPNLDPFECSVDDHNHKTTSSSSTSQAKSQNADDGNLRTFRLAIATTGEYSQYHITQQGVSDTATDDVKKAAVLSGIVTTIARVNGIYERDVSLTMILVDNTSDVIFLDGDTDDFSNDSASDLIDESQTVIDANIGYDNYDIGHTFSTGGGGLAQLNSPCTTSKARGITGSSSPIGDSYDVDYVSHEMGHQYGANHTFNSESNGCGSGNRNDGTAVEPGSGSTIMAYAGLCSPYNVQTLSDDYFHQVSIQEMWENISEGNSTCAEITSSGNTVPTVEELSDYTVPISTALVLEANASDVDGDELTYCWEQLDIESAEHPLVSTSTQGPAFRSLDPTTDTKRYLPAIGTVVGGDLSSEWEVIPSVGRTMTFGVNVRDNNVNGGQTAVKELTLTFDEDSGPFYVTSQTTSETWSAGTANVVEWDVANTNAYPVNCSSVNILLSTDGGYTYPYTLASNVDNDGSSTVIAPNVVSSTVRVKIEAVDNVFYAINSADFEIIESDFIMTFTENSQEVCEPDNAVYSFEYNTYNSFSEEVTFSSAGAPDGTTVTFNPTTATADATAVEITVSGLSNSNIGDFELDIIGTSTNETKTTVAVLSVSSSTVSAPIITSPENNASGLLSPVLLTWEEVVNAVEYQVQVASDNTFSTFIIDETLTATNKELTTLDSGTTYYWRLKTINSCGESEFSETYSFTTEVIDCLEENSTDIPKDIPDNSITGVTSTIDVSNNLTITDLNVTINVTHPWIGDLTIELTSPDGTEVVLTESRSDDGDNYTNTVFDDDADEALTSGTAPYTGTFSPAEALSAFDNENSFGEWELKLVDGGAADIGTLDSWSLNICGVSTDEYSFEILTTGETCDGEDNGVVEINATVASNYTATLDGSSYSFTDYNAITNLEPGEYDLCISVDGSDFEQCYVIEIPEADTISGKTENTASKLNVEIESGTAPYKVYINSILILETSSKTISLDVKNGDIVAVKSSIECEGVLSKTISTFDEMTVYPNPTKGNVELLLPFADGIAVVKILNTQMQVIKVQSIDVVSGRASLSIENVPTGIYFGEISISGSSKSFKIIKE